MPSNSYLSFVKSDDPDKPDCTPSWCGENHGAKCFNAGRCLRASAKSKKGKARADKG